MFLINYTKNNIIILSKIFHHRNNILSDMAFIQTDMDKRTQFYRQLKKKLKKDTTFPSKYLFKFIVPSDEDKIIQIENMFNFLGAVITKTSSKTGKFTSVSILVIMKKADDIIAKYKEAEKIEGIISL